MEQGKEDLLADLNPMQREAVHALRGPTADPGGGRQRQDARHHPPRRLAAPAGRPARQHPGHHLHQQGRRRDAPARRRRWCPAAASGSAPSTASARACSASTPTGSSLDRNFTIYDQSDRGPHRQDGPGRRRHRQRPLHAGNHRRPSARPKTSCSRPRRYAERAAISSKRSSPASIPSTRSDCATPTPWTSTICSTGPPWPSSTTRNCAPSWTPASASC